MPLKTEADYERLAEHLREIDHIVESFSDTHGYTLPKWPLGGRYPQRKMHKQCGMVWRSIQISMDNRPDGECYDEFFPEIPYTVFGAAWVDDFDVYTRWHAPNIRMEGIPFTELLQSIPLYLSQIHGYISLFEGDTIRSFGKTSKLASRHEE